VFGLLAEDDLFGRKMSTEVIIAIITAIASLVVAVTSLVSSIISNRQSARLAETLETLRFELDEKKTTRTTAGTYLDSGLEALATLIQATQRMKDIVQLTLTARGTSLDSESAMKSILDARQNLFNCYEEQLASLGTIEASGAHKAKNVALDIEARLREFIGDDAFISLSSYQKRVLTELRNELTDAQNLLRDSRTTQLLKRLGSGE
jgi:hypothetical protein